MESSKLNLKGSPKRDLFKRKHKDINKKFWATDIDFALVSKSPPGIVAYLDYKTTTDRLIFAEAIVYNEWMKTHPVYIVVSDDPEHGPFKIKTLIAAFWEKEPVNPLFDDVKEILLRDWREFEKWELGLRQDYYQRGGWQNGKS